MIVECVDMHCTLNGADKVYHLAIEEGGGAYTVRFAYGRRGHNLTFGTKTLMMVTLEAAQKIYKKQITQQFAKGYVNAPGVSGNVFGTASYAVTANGITAPKAQSGILPQLLNVITKEQLEKYYADPDWGMQEKFDGERRMVLTGPNEGINKKGQHVPLMPAVQEDANKLMPGFLIDGEAIGETLYAFDMLTHSNRDIRSNQYLDRYRSMTLVLALAGCHNIIPVPLFVTEYDKRRLVQDVNQRGGEGVCIKRLASVFTAGRPNSGGDQLKYKFWESCTCIVTGLNNSRSVSIAATDGFDWVGIGNVTIPPNWPIPAVNAFVEVRYLYYYPGGSLFQPQFEGERTDCDQSDCDINKLKLKVTP